MTQKPNNPQGRIIRKGPDPSTIDDVLDSLKDMQQTENDRWKQLQEEINEMKESLKDIALQVRDLESK